MYLYTISFVHIVFYIYLCFLKPLVSIDVFPAGHSSLGNLPSLSYGSVYMKLWHGLCGLDNDPHPSVAIMAQKVTNHIRNQVE